MLRHLPIVLFLTACEGVFAPAAAPRVPQKQAAQTCDGAPVVIPEQRIRRLTNNEYSRTMRDLFPTATVQLPALPEQASHADFDNIAETLGADDLLVQRWEQGAFLYASALTQTEAALAAFLPCASSNDPLACGRTLVREVGLKIFRRPLEAEELERYDAFFAARLADIDFRGAVQLTLVAMLQSPAFLYRIEYPTPPAPALTPLDGYAVATRVSYFLTGSTPDEALLAAAGQNGLATKEQVEAHARRLLQTPAARKAAVEFHRQWLDFDRIEELEHGERAPSYAAMWNETLRAAIREEQDRFVESTLFDGEGTVRALLTSTKTFVNASLARLYGVPGPADDQTWVPAELPATERAGILTRAGFLASHSHSVDASPPLRGIFISTRLLCEPTPAPPPGVNTSAPTAAPGEGPTTNRERYEARTSPASCQGCHARMNGLGYGFEHYDAIGAYRTHDAGKPVDASGEIIGTDVDRSYNGALELSAALAESEEVRSCVTSKWLRFATGRAPTTDERCATERLAKRFEETQGDVKDLLVAIVTSDEFRHRPTVLSQGGAQ